MDTDTKGKLTVRYEPDTGFICLAYPTKVIDEEVALLLLESIGPYQVMADASGDPTFILSDARELTGMTAEARKVFAGTRNPSLKHPQSYIASFGGGFAFRSLAYVVANGLLLGEKRRAYFARKPRTSASE